MGRKSSDRGREIGDRRNDGCGEVGIGCERGEVR